MWFKIGGSLITGLEKGCRGGGALKAGLGLGKCCKELDKGFMRVGRLTWCKGRGIVSWGWVSFSRGWKTVMRELGKL